MTTRQNLIDKLAKAEEFVKTNDEYRRKAVDQQHLLEAEIKEVRKQFADLKERLSNSELENQRLRGYIARVQEDDTVREELIVTGDPDGERQMVPKRKPTQFLAPSQYRNFEQEQMGLGYTSYHDRDRPKPKHWVNY